MLRSFAPWSPAIFYFGIPGNRMLVSGASASSEPLSNSQDIFQHTVQEPMSETSTDHALSITSVGELSCFSKFLLHCSCSAICPHSQFRLAEHIISYPYRPIPMMFPPEFMRHARSIRASRDTSTLHSVVSKLCRTPTIDLEFLSKCVPQRYHSITPLTCGGMSRIYSALDRESGNLPVVIKVTECA